MALDDLAQDVTDFRQEGGIVDFLFGQDTTATATLTESPTRQDDGKGNGKPYSLTMYRGRKEDGEKEEVIGIYNFLVNPETVNYDFPSRTTVIQTLGGAVIDTFGAGIPTITLTGTTGWNRRDIQTDGFSAFRALYEFYRFYQNELINPVNNNSKEQVYCVFDDGPSGLDFEVHLQDLKFPRTKQRPLLFPFTLTMKVLDGDRGLSSGDPDTFDDYVVFFTGGRFRNLLTARTAEIRAKLDALGQGLNVTPTGFQQIAQVGKDVLDTVDNLVSIGEDSLGLVQDSANFITQRLRRVSRAVVGVSRILQTTVNLPSNIATQFISAVNVGMLAFNDINCLLQDFDNSRALRPKVRLITGGDSCAAIIGADTPSTTALSGANSFEDLSSGGAPPEILDSVSLDGAAVDSLILLESVDPVLEDFGSVDPLTELTNIVDGLFIDTGVDYPTAVSEAGLDISDVDVITDTETITVNQGTTLQTLATQRLGDTSRWEEIALLNNLRWPYISNEFIYTLGPKMSDMVVVSGSGDTYVFSDIEGASVDQQIYFSNGVNEEAVTILSVDPVTNTLVFTSATTVDYTSLAQCSLHEDPDESSTVVLKIGDQISIPIDTSSGNSVKSDEVFDDTDFNRLFGLDIQLTETGELTFGETGDFVITETGVDNIVQSLRIRINTSPSDLKYHQDYGVGIPERVGEIASPRLANQIQRLLERGLPRDPRVSVVRNSSAAIEGDQIGIKFDAAINNQLTLTNLNFVATR